MNENFKKVFLDTTPIIYLLDSDKNFGEKTCEILSALSNYLVYPYRLKNEALIKSFWELLSNLAEIKKHKYRRAASSIQQ